MSSLECPVEVKRDREIIKFYVRAGEMFPSIFFSSYSYSKKKKRRRLIEEKRNFV